MHSLYDKIVLVSCFSLFFIHGSLAAPSVESDVQETAQPDNASLPAKAKKKKKEEEEMSDDTEEQQDAPVEPFESLVNEPDSSEETTSTEGEQETSEETSESGEPQENTDAQQIDITTNTSDAPHIQEPTIAPDDAKEAPEEPTQELPTEELKEALTETTKPESLSVQESAEQTPGDQQQVTQSPTAAQAPLDQQQTIQDQPTDNTASEGQSKPAEQTQPQHAPAVSTEPRIKELQQPAAPNQESTRLQAQSTEPISPTEERTYLSSDTTLSTEKKPDTPQSKATVQDEQVKEKEKLEDFARAVHYQPDRQTSTAIQEKSRAKQASSVFFTYDEPLAAHKRDFVVPLRDQVRSTDEEVSDLRSTQEEDVSASPPDLKPLRKTHLEEAPFTVERPLMPKIDTVYATDFSSRPYGWSLLGTEEAPTNYAEDGVGQYFGPFSLYDTVSKTISLTQKRYLKLSFDWLRIDRWEWFPFQFSVNGIVVFVQGYHSHIWQHIHPYGKSEPHKNIAGLGRYHGGGDWTHDQKISFEFLYEVTDGLIKFLDPNGQKREISVPLSCPSSQLGSMTQWTARKDGADTLIDIPTACMLPASAPSIIGLNDAAYGKRTQYYAGFFAQRTHVSRKIDLTNAGDFIQIAFYFCRLGSWDNERFVFSIDGTEIVTNNFLHGNRVDTEHFKSLDSNQYLVDMRFHKTDGTLILIDEAGEDTETRTQLIDRKITIDLHDDLDGAVRDEAWGFKDFVVRHAQTQQELGSRFKPILESATGIIVYDQLVAGQNGLRLDFAASTNSNASWGFTKVKLEQSDTLHQWLPMVETPAEPVQIASPTIHMHDKFSDRPDSSCEWLFSDGDQQIHTSFAHDPNIGRFAGPFSFQEQAQKMIPLTDPGNYLLFSIVFLRIDFWENSKFNISVNDKLLVDDQHHSHNSNKWLVYGEPENHRIIAGAGQSEGGWDWQHDQITVYTLLFQKGQKDNMPVLFFLNPNGTPNGLILPFANSSLTVKLFAQDPRHNAQWGFDNVVVASAQKFEQFQKFDESLASFRSLAQTSKESQGVREVDTSNFAQVDNGWRFVLTKQPVPTQYLSDGNTGRLAGPFFEHERISKTIELGQLQEGSWLQIAFKWFQIDRWWDNPFKFFLNNVEIFSQKYHAHRRARPHLFGVFEPHRNIAGLGRSDAGWDWNHDQVINFVFLCQATEDSFVLFTPNGVEYK